jgi:glycosyltransferase involved in cell wall biosynthesis
MNLRIGIVLGQLNSTGAPWQYISTLTEKLASKSEINVYGLYTGGNEDIISDSVTLVDVSSKNPLPTWHRASRQHELDLFHVNVMPKFGHWPVFRADIPVVVTAHGVPHWMDLSGLSRPSRKFNIEYRWRDRIGRYTVDAVFTVSEAVRDVYIERAGYSAEKVINTYEGIANRYFESSPKSHPRDMPHRYLLHVSNVSYKKNVRTILDAVQLLNGRREEVPPLVIAGRGWEEELSDVVEKMRLSGKVYFTGYVDVNRLLGLYDNAEMFVFPSLRESFGLPNVEAMARGTPVISSDKFAIPEIVDGGGIVLDDPLDERELADAISRLLTDDQLRADLISSGQSQAKKFTWDTHIKRLVNAYRTVIDQN